MIDTNCIYCGTGFQTRDTQQVVCHNCLYSLRRCHEIRREKKLAKNRDNHACVACGTTIPLEVHHIRPMAHGGSNNMRNLVTLCIPCHRDTHSIIKVFAKVMPAFVMKFF